MSPSGETMTADGGRDTVIQKVVNSVVLGYPGVLVRQNGEFSAGEFHHFQRVGRVIRADRRKRHVAL